MGSINIAIVIWRELFEAILIVSIVHASLVRELPKTRVQQLIAMGVCLGTVISAGLGYGFKFLEAQLSAEVLDRFQTVILLACAGFMTQMCLWMQRRGRTLKKDLESAFGEATSKLNAAMIVVLITVAIIREGFEAVVYLYGMGLAGGAAAAAYGGLCGAGLALISGLALVRGMRFISTPIFFRLTGLFLLLTAASLVATAATRLLQAGLLQNLQAPLWDTSYLLDDQSRVGQIVAAVTGYQATPAALNVLAYLGYWCLYFGLKRRRLARGVSPARAALALSILVLPWPCLGAEVPENAPKPAVSPADRVKIKASSFGDMQFSYYDYRPTTGQVNGAPRDARLSFDTTRLETEIEAFYLPYDVAVEADLEFEHGGTGSAKEQNPNEPGQYTSNSEKGGEVLLEELYLKKYFSSDIAVAVGRLMVDVGLVSLHHLPTDYLAVQRSEAETHIIPEDWTAMGVQGDFQFGNWRVLAEAVNSLDSSGFSSQYWIASGNQQSFEQTAATDLASVLRLDYSGFPGATVGASGYYGNTSRNRPAPDLVNTPCSESSTARVAPCGYIHAPVTVLDLHAQLNLEHLRGSAEIISGKLENAAAITSRNATLPESLDVPRNPVADGALGYFVELGYDVADALALRSDSRLLPFVRYDYYNTMFKIGAGTARNPLYERRVTTLGAAYILGEALFAKFDVSQRTFGAGSLRSEDTAEIGLGFLL